MEHSRRGRGKICLGGLVNAKKLLCLFKVRGVRKNRIVASM